MLSEVLSTLLGCHQEYLLDDLRRGRKSGLEVEFQVVGDLVYDFMNPKVGGSNSSGCDRCHFFPIFSIRHNPTPVMMAARPKMIPPKRAAFGSFSPRFVPIKAMVNPKKRTQIPSNIHFQKGMGIPRSSIHSLNPITVKQTKTPSRNQNSPLLKKCMIDLL